MRVSKTVIPITIIVFTLVAIGAVRFFLFGDPEGESVPITPAAVAQVVEPEVVPTPEPPEPIVIEETPESIRLSFENPRQLIYEGGDLHLVSRFTTYHPCCADRVTNIQRMADLVDEVSVAPGATFSLNEYVGERTEEKGFVPAGTIMAGELVDTVGGGVSQFATTLYNAIYWAGLEDVSHQPHSWTFSRYPTGIEATISWPRPDLQFKNNTEHPIILHTTYTDRSITVEVWGRNDGRIISGDHKNGQTTTETLQEGGSNAKIVSSYVTPPYRELTNIPTLVYPNYAIRPGFAIEMDAGTPGKIMNVFRTITQNGIESINTWRVVYKPIPREVHVHPCSLQEEGRVHEFEKFDYSWLDCSTE